MNPTNLKEACDAFIDHLRDTGVNPNSLASYMWNLTLLINHFGEDKDLNKLLAAHVANFYRSEAVTTKTGKGGEKVPRGAGSVAQIRRVVRWALTWFVEQSWIERLPLPAEDRQAAEDGQTGPGKRRCKAESAGGGGLKADSADTIPISEPTEPNAVPVGEPQTGAASVSEPGEGFGQGAGFNEGQSETAGPEWTLL